MPEIVAPGDRLGDRYRLDRRLGAGGMATVWRAVDLVLDRAVAVKVPKEGWPEEFTRRLRQEAQAAAGLTHPSITGVYDYGEHQIGPEGPGGSEGSAPQRRQGSVPYVVMELLDGESLAARLSRGPLPWREAAGIGARVADALAAAHAAGIVHRDVKPANVFLTSVGVKVLDFGIAFTGPATAGGPVLGTPAYVAPELLAGAHPTPAADLYSLGVVLRACLTAGPDIPDEVAALTADCLREDPETRPTAREAARVLADAAGVQLEQLPPAGATAVPAGAAPEGERQKTRVLAEPPSAQPAPASARRPLIIAGAAVGAVVLVAVLLAALAPDSSHERAAPPSASPSGTTTAAATACSVSYTVDGTWPQGFQATVRITNLGDGAIDGWKLGFEFPDGQAITQLWNGSQVQDGPSVTVTAADWNRSIPPHGTAEFGFLGRQDGANGAPAAFTLNGGACGG
ncbi:protein kinase domain-containing protein [Actinomadura bangladeshensis]|uniref:non-specific serine/threonine protein kinase n=1 Tax=Actinomadura bangladeshensis TaxID=453573 RepID=A0A4R4P3F1_9ACTN|nr:cellulose binding domain-containing protein [Actinomadura bangladeshensis]TDC16881.1 serine/threonine protein kinase [Actinomadura bangladeshensis]